MAAGADRMSMPEVPAELFVEAVRQTVEANQAYVPPLGSGSLYLRPLLLGTGAILGLGEKHWGTMEGIRLYLRGVGGGAHVVGS